MHSWLKTATLFTLPIVLTLLLSGCGSTYLFTRKSLIKERIGTYEIGKSRAEIEERWGEPVWERSNPDGTTACTYEYNALSEAWVKPLDTVVPGGGEGGVIFFVLAESAIFPYYVAKDIAIRDRFRAKVIYDAEGVVIREHHYRIDNLVSIPPYVVSPQIKQHLKSYPCRKAYVDTFIVATALPDRGKCDMEVAPMLPMGEMSLEDYLRDSLNKELEVSGLYDPVEGVHLFAKIVHVSNSHLGIISGTTWNITMVLTGPDGHETMVTTEYLCRGNSTCQGLADCFPNAIAATFDDMVQTAEFCFYLAIDPLACPPLTSPAPSALAQTQPKTPSLDPLSPWRGRWVVSSGNLGGVWILQQTGERVVSAPDSDYVLEATVQGNTIRGTWAERGDRPRDFRATISEDASSFNAQAFYWTYVFFTANRSD